MIEKLKESYNASSKREKVSVILSFIGYVLVIMRHIPIKNVALDTISSMAVSIIVCISVLIYLNRNMYNRQTKKERFCIILREIIMYIPIVIIQIVVINTIVTGESINQAALNEEFIAHPFTYILAAVIIGPIYEEVIFRYYPSKFIKNKVIYVIVTSFIFAYMHVANDANWINHIWGYMILSLYYGYRYAKTEDIAVTVALHRTGNLIAVISKFLAL